MTTHFGSTVIELVKGDITQETVDAIVNAANKELVGGGGVDGAIHRSGGPEIMQECDRIRETQGGCPTGTAVKTTAGRLQAKAILHTAGPRFWDHPPEEAEELLRGCYQSCLELARQSSFRSIAFPSISTGVYGYPISEAAPVALRTTRAFCEQHDAMDLVRFVLFSDGDLEVYQRCLQQLEMK